jgi:hypothetical protein
MKWLRNIRIDIERWIFRKRSARNQKRDISVQCKYIRKANRQSKRANKQLWVFRFGPSDYFIFTKPQVKSAVRDMHVAARINIHQTNEYIVHITKKPE